MIVLDEQISNKRMVDSIRAWYPGAVISIRDLRPGTIILDDAIPSLLHKKRQPAFVTINVTDFWQKVAIDDRFCVVCFAVKNAPVIALLLKELFHKEGFRTKQQRTGQVFRIKADGEIGYYRYDDQQVCRFTL